MCSDLSQTLTLIVEANQVVLRYEADRKYGFDAWADVVKAARRPPDGAPLPFEAFAPRGRGVAWRLGYAVRRRDEAWSLIYDSASDAGVLELRKGDRRLPALVTFHGGLGTPAGALLPSYLRAEVTVVALQAPELRDPTVPSPGSAAGRARAYCAAAADHLGPGSRGVTLLGHSLCGNQPLVWGVPAKLQNPLSQSNRSRFG